MPREPHGQKPTSPQVEPTIQKRPPPRDGLTTAERETPYTDDPHLLVLEAAAAEAIPNQLALFLPGANGKLMQALGGIGALAPKSSLELARAWYRRELEQARRPRNTIESYGYDLAILQDLIGPKQIDQITRADIARFLGGAENRSTRKRRLTSIRRFFRFLIDDAKVLGTSIRPRDFIRIPSNCAHRSPSLPTNKLGSWRPPRTTNPGASPRSGSCSGLV